MRYPRVLAVLAGLAPGLATAQDAGDGGMVLSFGLSQRFEATTDRDLDTAGRTPGQDSITRLSFGFSDTTRTEALTLDLGTGLRISSEDGAEVSDPSITLGYSRTGPNAALSASTSWTRTDIAFQRDATDFIDANGDLVLPDDLDALSGTGTRTARSHNVRLQWGTARPVGYDLRLGLRTLRYDDAGDALVDADTTTLGLGVRLNLTPTLTGRLDIDQSRYDPADAAAEDTTRASFGLTLDRPTGDLTTQISATRADDGDLSWGISLGGSTALPGMDLSGSIGLTQDSDGDAQVTGRLAYSRALPDGALSLRGQRAITTGGANDGRRSTTLQASYSHEIGPLSNLQVGFDYVRAEEAGDGTDVATGSLSASYGLRLTPDWQLNLGARANLRDDGDGRARSSTVFVALDRSFTWRP